MSRLIRTVLFILIVVIVAALAFFFVGSAEEKDVTWGVNFSQKHSTAMGLDWKANYTALLDDLGVRHIKTVAYWDMIQPQPGSYLLEDLDWQMAEAAKRNAEVLLVIGRKVPRWPECHVPEWVQQLPREERDAALFELVETLVNRYEDSPALWAWQVENEPLHNFGECDLLGAEFLQKEVDVVRAADDNNHPVVISDTGEFSLWHTAAQIADVVGVTTYRVVWSSEFGFYIRYPIPPVFYDRRAQLVKWLYEKPTVGVELQAEPWGPELLYTSPLDEQAKTMNPEAFQQHVRYAERTGIDMFYLWGSEWWFWMKEVQRDDGMWELARKLF